ncbi:2Fe-2S iron-sulfur cluster-binding protein [Bradyrhizobium sp. LHD-71]|uniref:(2Fe-2S)-binding protein n=1 Tax=Bradyrhizobium sp. LHD-71 TaxID=3072141 RepID=UPI00280FE1D3|nr:2Fe-2S iron-sulfur cluster-binding protein [Bradyrhizobium sp. LHD-71]MDQ8727679.1 (2Fe-2S)-binding protein [Bradyrhizobium sp. LHD-71]
MINLTVNGQQHAVDADPDKPLLWVLREDLGLTGTKYGCGVAACGACTVHVDGEAARSCSLPLRSVAKAAIVTIEGLAASTALPAGQLHPVQDAWIRGQVPQCGYCQSGMIMTVAALLDKNASPTPGEIDSALGNLCRCGTYARVRKAIQSLVAKA